MKVETGQEKYGKERASEKSVTMNVDRIEIDDDRQRGRDKMEIFRHACDMD